MQELLAEAEAAERATADERTAARAERSGGPNTLRVPVPVRSDLGVPRSSTTRRRSS